MSDRDELRDELSGWPIGSGYYQSQAGSDEAGEMADVILSSDWLARVKREAAQEATDREARRYKAAIDNWKAIAADAETKIGDAWWEGVTAQWQHRPMGNRVLETDNPYRKQVTE